MAISKSSLLSLVCGRNINIESNWEDLGSHWNASSGVLHSQPRIFVYIMKLNQYCTRFRQTYFFINCRSKKHLTAYIVYLSFFALHIHVQSTRLSLESIWFLFCLFLKMEWLAVGFPAMKSSPYLMEKLARLLCASRVPKKQNHVYVIWDYVSSRKILQPLSHHLQQACWKPCLQTTSNDALTWMRKLSIMLHRYSIHLMTFYVRLTWSNQIWSPSGKSPFRLFYRE